MLEEAINTLLSAIGSLPPSAGFLAVVVATFILEDVAIVATALLASTDMMAPSAGLIALLVGIVLGDLGLFGIGYGAARLPMLRKYVDTRAAQRIRRIGTNRPFSLVFTTRFVPGMRLPTYTSLGYVGASFWKFLQAVLFAVGVWTVSVYSAVFFLGQSVLADLGPWKYAAIGLALAAVFLIERSLAKKGKARAQSSEERQSHAAS
ncbi:MAG: VTT domain-containing protein [Pseudomonadota bacterium]